MRYAATVTQKGEVVARFRNVEDAHVAARALSNTMLIDLRVSSKDNDTIYTPEGI